jgi:hypothetical protein
VIGAPLGAWAAAGAIDAIRAAAANNEATAHFSRASMASSSCCVGDPNFRIRDALRSLKVQAAATSLACADRVNLSAAKLAQTA